MCCLAILLENLIYIKSLLSNFFERAKQALATIAQNKHFFGLAQELKLVSNQDYALILESARDRLLEDAVGYSRVYS